MRLPTSLTRRLAGLSLLVAGAVLVAGCGTRTLVLTYTKAKADDAEVLQDKQALQSVKGIQKVIVDHQSTGRVSVELYVEDEYEAAAAKKALDLGYDKNR